MKTLLKIIATVVFIFTLQSCFVSESSFYNEETKGNATITKVNVPMFLVKPYIRKALKEENESEAIINLINKIRKIKIYTVENGTENMANSFHRKTFGSEFQEYLTINSKESKVKILSKETGDTIKNFIINVKDGNDLVFIDIKGKFTIDDLSKIGNLAEKNNKNIKNIE